MTPWKNCWMDYQFSPKSTRVIAGTNKRPFFADLVLYECASDAN